MKVLRLVRVAAVVACFILATGLGLGASANSESRNAAEEISGEIAFVSDRLEQEIFVINADGTGARELSHDPGWATGPVPSPDGKRIAFSSSRHGKSEVYVMSVDGSGQRRLTQDAATDVVHDWSPDGSELAVVSDRDGTNQIYAMRVDGGGIRQLTAGDPSGDPAWSPDGMRVVFVRSGELWLMNSDGTGEHRFTSDPQSVAANPAWAPNGSQLVFIRVRPGFPFATVMVNTIAADGTGVRTIATCFFGGEPTWSPDGRRIAFRIGTGLFSMNSDGSDRRRLTSRGGSPDELGDDSPRWLKDGRIVLMRRLGSELYLRRLPGGVTRRLTSDVGPYDVAWSPNGRALAYVRRGASRFRGDIYLLTVGTGLPARRLVRGGAPTWSPDGKRIAFSRGGNIYVVRATGGRVRKLVVSGVSPSWSPKGGRILFVRPGRWPISRLWIVGTDGRGARRLPMARAEAPDWSPDGRRIVFGDGRELRVVNADGSGNRRLSRSSATGTLLATPSWSPDGRWIAYERSDDSIWIVRADGSRARRVAGTPLWDRNWAPDWR